MRQTFTILLVEDRPEAMKSQIEEIEKYLQEKEFEPKIIMNKTGENIDKILKDNDVDIIVTDENLTEKTSGTDVVNLIKSKNPVIDVLFYSAKGINPEDIREHTGHYSFIEIIEGKEILESLKKLIDKNVKRCNDIVFLRGMVISESIDMELEINDFFATYFIKTPKYKRDIFNDFILENRNTTMFGKIASLSKLLDKHNLRESYPIITKLNDISNERNLLAHSKKVKGNILVSMGKEEKFDRERIRKILAKIKTVSDYLEKLKKEEFRL